MIGLALPAASMKEKLGSNKFSIGWGSQTLYVNGATPIPFGPKIVQGDVISVEVYKFLAYYVK